MIAARHGDRGWVRMDRTPSLSFPWMAVGASSRPSAPQAPERLAPRKQGKGGRQDWHQPFTDPAGGCRAPAGSALQPSFGS